MQMLTITLKSVYTELITQKRHNDAFVVFIPNFLENLEQIQSKLIQK